MLLTLHQRVREVRAAPALIDYILALVHRTRELPGLRQGLSPRAGLGLRRAAQAWALIEGRSGVIPEDVQAVFAAVVNHRLVYAPALAGAATSAAVILALVAIPLLARFIPLFFIASFFFLPLLPLISFFLPFSLSCFI